MDFINQNMQVFIAAAVTLVVLVIVLMVWRAVSPRMSGRRGQRLGISEYYELDKTRRLVLIRRDNVEHLVMIGGPEDVVVEQGITVAGLASSYVPTPATFAPIPSPVDQGPILGANRPAPRPAVFGDRRPPALRSIEPGMPPPLRERDETEK
jgi:hypothetical protein